MSKPVPEPVEGWTFRRSQTGRLRATIDGWAAEIIEGELWSQTATPLAVVRALLADATPLTVGAALADARVQDGTHAVEYRAISNSGWWQMRVVGLAWKARTRADGYPWRMWKGSVVLPHDVTKPCRLVPLAEADDNPETRSRT